MTTGRPARKSSGPQAGADPSPGTAPQATPLSDAETGPPDDVEQLRQEVERTREQLGATVEQLAAKADVKARARHKAAELTGKAKDQAGRAGAQAVAGAGTVRDQLASTTADASEKAKSVTGQFSGRLAVAGARVDAAMPPTARRAVAKGAGRARQYRVPLAVAACALMVGYLIVRRRTKR
jgi:Protein of unknown function (DUF3618)